MFGFGLSKLLVLVAVVLAVWYGLKFFRRIDEMREDLKRAHNSAKRGQARAPNRGRTIEAEDLVKCRACGAYVAARGAQRCGRSDCPW
jgi:hypothetical protein